MIGGVTGMGFAHMYLQCPIIVFHFETTVATWFTGILVLLGVGFGIVSILTCCNQAKFLTLFFASAAIIGTAVLVYGIVMAVLEWIISSKEDHSLGCDACYWTRIGLGIVTGAVYHFIRTFASSRNVLNR